MVLWNENVIMKKSFKKKTTFIDIFLLIFCILWYNIPKLCKGEQNHDAKEDSIN